MVKLQSHFCLAPKGHQDLHASLWLLSWRPAEEGGMGGKSQASELPENDLLIAQATQALLGAVDNRTSSPILRGWMRRDHHGPLVAKQLARVPSREEGGQRLNCSLMVTMRW